eukprot:7373722-Prorocentrum_lima.AAC.1
MQNGDQRHLPQYHYKLEGRILGNMRATHVSASLKHAKSTIARCHPSAMITRHMHTTIRSTTHH